jgi:hypothetical protein
MHLKISSHRPFGRNSLERQFWLLLTVIAFVFLATIVARADEEVISIGLQKYRTLVLLNGKGFPEAESRLPGCRIAWAEFPASLQFREALSCGASDCGAVGAWIRGNTDGWRPSSCHPS